MDEALRDLLYDLLVLAKNKASTGEKRFLLAECDLGGKEVGDLTRAEVEEYFEQLLTLIMRHVPAD